MTHFESVDQFIQHLNPLRLSSDWYGGLFSVAGKQVILKSYGTWNQVLTVDSIRHGGAMGLNVSQWKLEIKDAIQGQKGQILICGIPS